MSNPTTRRSFLQGMGLGAVSLGMSALARGEEPPIQGFEKTAGRRQSSKGWKPISDRKIRVGMRGTGSASSGRRSAFRIIPMSTVTAVTDLDADRRAALAKAPGARRPIRRARRC